MKANEKKKDPTKDPAAEEQKKTNESQKNETTDNTADSETDNAAENADSQDGTDADEVTVDDEQSQTDEASENPSLEDLLKNPELKAAFDAKVQSAVDAAVANATDEAEKMASMTPEEKAGYETAKRERELEVREKALLAREMKATAIEELGKEQLPAVLADCFNYESEEAFKQTKDAVVKAFQEAIKESVNARLRGNNTPKISQDGNSGTTRTTNGSFANIVKQNHSRR